MSNKSCISFRSGDPNASARDGAAPVANNGYIPDSELYDYHVGNSDVNMETKSASVLSSDVERAVDQHDDYDDFELIDEVEWGASKGDPEFNEHQELAPLPRKFSPDPCGCQPVGIEYSDTGFSISSQITGTCPQLQACLDDNCILFATQEECGKNCEAGPTCGNKRLQRKQFCSVERFDAGVKGNGLRLTPTGKCRKGDIVCEYVGKAIAAPHLPRLFRKYQTERRLYIMALGDGIYLDARHKGGLARFINHSCDPNCRVERWKVRGVIRAAVVALRDMQPLEEFTFDYQWDRKRGYAPTICHCGSAICRGTLEASKSLEELDLQKELEGHWERVTGADETIVNRTIQVFSAEHQEYFIGEITGYDSTRRLHSVFYRHDMTEVFEDLNNEEWMILNEIKDKEHFMIARKQNPRRTSSKVISIFASKEHATQQTRVKNYIYVQTPIKEAFWSRHLIDRCERNCNVQIQAEQKVRPPLPPNPKNSEDVEKYAALDKSLDGSVWKLTVTGSCIARALLILEKNVSHLERKLATVEDSVQLGSNSFNIVRSSNTNEMIFPRQIADIVKRRINIAREVFKSVSISFIVSNSKDIAKLLVDGSIATDIESAKKYLWELFSGFCVETALPVTSNGMFRSLGFGGGMLSNRQLELLCLGRNEEATSIANMDLIESAFVKSFENTNRCVLWIQSPTNEGRSNHVDEKILEPGSIFFGCRPEEVGRLSAMVLGRATDLERGVKYIYLGRDRVYLAQLLKNGSNFFHYVGNMTGASVEIDSMTGDHVRIDGRLSDSESKLADETIKCLTDSQRADCAQELIRLQIELYRDSCIRKYPWIFGRDWSLVDVKTTVESETRGSMGSFGILDKRFASQCVMSCCEIITHLRLPATVAAHSSIILYRLLYANENIEHSCKIREAVLACVFIAGKAHKQEDSVTLLDILEGGYKVFYPATPFDASSAEVGFLGEKVISVEKETLEALTYDVFWSGVDFIRNTVEQTGKFKKDFFNSVLDLAFSSEVLAAGPELWLKYGAEYVFAAVVAFLDADLTVLISSLSLIPLKVSQAAELLIAMSKVRKSLNKETPSHYLLECGMERLKSRLPRIVNACVELTTRASPVGDRDLLLPASIQGNKLFHMDNNQLCYRTIRQIPHSLFVYFSSLDKISVESCCNIFVGDSGTGSYDIVLHGVWRSIAVAYHLLKLMTCNKVEMPPLEELPVHPHVDVAFRAKISPGFLSSFDVETSGGWEGTIQLSYANGAVHCGHLGGKNYVAAKVEEASLRRAGCRWVIPSVYAVSPSGSITDMCFPDTDRCRQLSILSVLAESFVGSDKLRVLCPPRQGEGAAKRLMPISCQRWPPEKVHNRETQRWRRSKKNILPTGFSPQALQEMQTLRQLHGAVPSARGHPNFVLPFAIAIPGEEEMSRKKDSPVGNHKSYQDSLFRPSDNTEKTAKRSKKVKESPSLIFHPAPFTLHRILSRKIKRVKDKVSPSILLSWIHDCVSMLFHCHSCGIVLCTLQGDQIIIDQNGVAKLGSLYRSKSVSRNSATSSYHNNLKQKTQDQHDLLSDLHAAPEILLGSAMYGKETDIWALGSMFAHLLLNKPVFSGKDRESFLMSQYKIVGTPAKKNFPDAVKFPHYTKPSKKYVPDVQKALKKLMSKEAESLDEEVNLVHFEKAIDLVSRMLRLNPSDRCSAAEALESPCLLEYREKSRTYEFWEQYSLEWMEFKNNLMVRLNGEIEPKQPIRGEVLMAMKPSSREDLYDMEEIIENHAKKQKRL